MPWEKTFDTNEAIDRATEVFWKKGYDATSMSDLITAMRINKGSLYNAFGSKKQLFDLALARYDQTHRSARLSELRAWPDPVAAIKAFFDGMIDDVRDNPENLGCFVINTAQDLPNQPPEIAAIVRSSLKDIESFFSDSIRKGQQLGDISNSIDPETTAQALLSMLVGLRLMSRGAVGIPVLEGVRDGAMRLLKT